MNETQPLLQPSAEQQHEEAIAQVAHQADLNLDIDFDPAGDPDNPQEWSDPYKWLITGLLSAMAFTVTLTCVSVVPIANTIVADLSGGEADKASGALLVTIWELGEAAGPVLIAPLSEVLGRAPVIHFCNTLFVVTVVLSALCQSSGLFIALRALTGVFVASNVLNPAVVGDIYPHEKRGAAMSIIWLAPLCGGAFGPAIAGVVAQTMGWRRVIWLCAAVAGACELAFLLCFRETYRVPILRRRALARRKHAGVVMAEEEAKTAQKNDYRSLAQSIVRPASVIGRSVVLAVMSLFGAVVFAQFYVMSVTLPVILEEIYLLNPAQAGAALMAFSSGSIVAVLLCNAFLDRIYVALRDRNQGLGQPEFRLPLTIIGGVLLPIPLALYGWFAEWHLPIAALLFVTALMAVAEVLVLVTLSAYVVDAFGLYSASAMTGLIVSRCLVGSLFPLSAAPLVERLGYGWGFTVIAACPLVLSPIPILVMRYGPVWRQWSRYTRE